MNLRHETPLNDCISTNVQFIVFNVHIMLPITIITRFSFFLFKHELKSNGLIPAEKRKKAKHETTLPYDLTKA